MIKEKELCELRPQVKYQNGQGITLDAVRSTLSVAAQQSEIPIAFSMDQVKTGGLLGSAEECLVISHPDHQKDYFSIVVRVKHQGTFAFVNTDSYGVSKLMKSEAIRQQINASAKESFNRVGTNDYSVINAAASGASFVAAGVEGVRHLIKGKSDKEKMEAEKQWYAIICDFLSLIDG